MDQNSIEALKKAHDHYVNAHQIITQRTQFYAEEFEAVQGCTAFLKRMAISLKEQIEKLEKESANAGSEEVQASPAEH